MVDLTLFSLSGIDYFSGILNYEIKLTPGGFPGEYEYSLARNFSLVWRTEGPPNFKYSKISELRARAVAEIFVLLDDTSLWEGLA